MVKLSDYVMNFLAATGVRHVFMLPGGGAMHLNDSLGRCASLEYTCFLHEQALAIAAEAYGQYTNFPGVAMVTSGPGGTNAITGTAAAYIDSTPCLFISGQAKRSDLKGSTGVRQMGSQEVDIVSMVSCITKYAVTILEPNEVRYHLEKAWHEATSGRKGPVWLDIPLDVQAAMIDDTKLAGFSPGQKQMSVKTCSSLTQIISCLNNAQRPLILAGNGVRLASAEDLLCSFAENYRIPVLLTWKAIDFLDSDHPLNFGSPGIVASRAANFIVQNCDCLLILGCRLEPSVTAFNSRDFGFNAKKIMVDIDETEIQKIAGIDIPVAMDAGDFLRLLNHHKRDIQMQDSGQWLTYCRNLKERYPVVLDEYRRSDDHINLYVFTEALFKQLSSEDVITPESSGAAGEVIYQAIRVKKGQKIRNAAGLGAMGFGLPYATGACIANDRKRTILINGDGAFQLNIQELQTLARLKLPVKIFILNNDGYASIRSTQDKIFGGFHVGSGSDSGLTMPEISKIALAYGIRHESAVSHRELDQAITKTLSGSDPVLCSIQVSANHVTAPRVQAMKTTDGGMISKPLEDMWPYLPSDEISRNMIAKRSQL